MNLNNLRPAEGSVKTRKRVGRGAGSGLGCTSTRGHKGINDLIEAGFISSNQLVKVLGNGSLTTKLDVEANAFSKSAVAAIEAVGGNAVKL